LHGWGTFEGRGFSRAYIRHLFASGEMLGPILVTLHNLRFFQRLTADLRAAIRRDDWAGFAAARPHLADLVAAGSGNGTVNRG
jgi:queuine tRNA-ribosyltransferase